MTNITLPALEQYTTFRILNDKTGTITLTASGTSLQLYDGSGGTKAATILDLAGGSVCEICYSTTTVLRMFGNGLSVNT